MFVLINLIFRHKLRNSVDKTSFEAKLADVRLHVDLESLTHQSRDFIIRLFPE